MVFSLIVGGLSVAVLASEKFHPAQSSRVQVSEGFLCSSAMTAIISAMHSTMLLFTFEGHETATRKDLVVAWSPVLLLDVSIGQYVLGLKFWSAGKGWIAPIVGAYPAVLFIYSSCIAIWMWHTMNMRGELGKRKEHADVETTRVADK